MIQIWTMMNIWFCYAGRVTLVDYEISGDGNKAVYDLAYLFNIFLFHDLIGRYTKVAFFRPC